MKKVVFLLFIFAFSSASAFSQVNEILKRMDSHQKALKSLQSNITIGKFFAQSKQTEMKEGVVKFLPTKKDYFLRIDSTKPISESFSIVKNQYLLYQPNPIYLPKLNIAFTGSMTDSQKITFMFFSILSNFSKEYLKATYNISYKGEEKVNDKTPTWHLELTPKTVQKFKAVELWVNGDGMPVQSKIIETNGDWTNILIDNLIKNVALKPDDFKPNLPKEIKLIKN